MAEVLDPTNPALLASASATCDALGQVQGLDSIHGLLEPCTKCLDEIQRLGEKLTNDTFSAHDRARLRRIIADLCGYMLQISNKIYAIALESAQTEEANAAAQTQPAPAEESASQPAQAQAEQPASSKAPAAAKSMPTPEQQYIGGNSFVSRKLRFPWF